MDHIYQNPEFGQEWFTYPDLYKEIVSKSLSGSIFVEVGSWKGKSSSYMSVEIANSKKDIKFYCVDHWLGSKEHYDINHSAYDPSVYNLYETFVNNMKPLENYYIPMRMTSIEASKHFQSNSLDFVFIDASHEYIDVCNDIDYWRPKIKKGGILAGHDYSDQFNGVKNAVNEKLKSFTVLEDQLCWVHYV